MDLLKNIAFTSGRSLKITKHLRCNKALSKCRKCAVLREGFLGGTKCQAVRKKKKMAELWIEPATSWSQVLYTTD